MPYREHLADRLATQLDRLIKQHGLEDADSAIISDCAGGPDADEADKAYWLVLSYSDRACDNIRLGKHFRDAQVSLDRAFQPS